jgi:hypothetical protein
MFLQGEPDRSFLLSAPPLFVAANSQPSAVRNLARPENVYSIDYYQYVKQVFNLPFIQINDAVSSEPCTAQRAACEANLSQLADHVGENVRRPGVQKKTSTFVSKMRSASQDVSGNIPMTFLPLSVLGYITSVQLA